MTGLDKPALAWHVLRAARQRGLRLAPFEGLAQYPALTGFDLDLLGDWHRWPRWEAFLGEALLNTGWHVAARIRRGHLLTAYLVRDAARPGQDDDFLQLDLHRAVTAHAIPLAAASPLLDAATVEHGMLWLPPAPAAMLREREHRIVHGVARRATAAEASPPSRGRRIAGALAQAVRHHPGLLVRVAAAKLRDAVAAYLAPPGRLWILCGPDGAGKSSAIGVLTLWLPRRLCRRVVVRHTRPFLLPRLAGWLGTAPDAARAPAAVRMPGRAMSALRLLIAWADFVVGYWLLVRPSLAAGDIVLFDRYVQDYVVDPVSRGIRLPGWAIRLMARGVPPGQGRILLVAPPEALAYRKGELSADEATRQLAAYRALAAADSGMMVIDSTTGTAADMAGLVMRRMIRDA